MQGSIIRYDPGTATEAPSTGAGSKRERFGECEGCLGAEFLLCRGVSIAGGDIRPCRDVVRVTGIMVLAALTAKRAPMTAAALARLLGSNGAKYGPRGSHRVGAILTEMVKHGTAQVAGEAVSGNQRMPTYAAKTESAPTAKEA